MGALLLVNRGQPPTINELLFGADSLAPVLGRIPRRAFPSPCPI